MEYAKYALHILYECKMIHKIKLNKEKWFIFNKLQ